jgi:opacity protein-like surface antigen
MFRAGVHGSFSVGGDVPGSALGYGVQICGDLKKRLSLELAGTRTAFDIEDWSEEPASVLPDSSAPGHEAQIDDEIILTTIAFSLRAQVEATDWLSAYAGGGLSYSVVQWDATDSYLSGSTLTTAAATLEGGVGYHACAGVEIGTGSILFFVEYRYAVVKTTGTLSLTYEDTVGIEMSLEDDVGFGLVRAGAGLRF